MTIQSMENNTKVLCPDGREGRLRVTRRERNLVDTDEHTHVYVLGSDGLQHRFKYSELEEIVVEYNDYEDTDCG